MDTVENVCKEVVKVLADFNAKGADDSVKARLEKLSSSAETLGMKSGKKLIDNFLTALKEGKTAESLTVRVTALEFYIKNVISSQGAIEDI